MEDLVVADPSAKRIPDRVLLEGAKLFRERGYNAATTRELASRLGINKASLYYYMAKKEDLLYEICMSSMTKIYEEVSAAVDAAQDPAGRLRAVIDVHLSSTLNDLDLHATMMLEMKSLVDDLFDKVVEARHRYESLIGSTIASAQSAGALRRDVPVSYLRILLFNMLNWPMTWYVPGSGMAPEKLAGYTYDIFMNGAGVANEAG
ncbi:MAG TPA: TetR/AcrR family transcriptional regulator [Jatrophihabitantaceae bacterium]|jgi:AcrR family transcriptional regulator|nr:TetR/AcrR family transcriptional regulator [Jatrophihabitantaceae bacterium]